MRIYNILIICIFLTLGACSKDEKEDIQAPVSRTLLVYFGMDNNFWPEAQEKIGAMTEGWSDYDGNLLVYVDARGSNPRLIWIHQDDSGKNVAETIKTFESENSADPAVLNRVVDYVTKHYPAKSYGMLVLSHASGWLPERTLGNARSVIVDGTHEMEMRDFAAALPVKFDFIIFDACFMGGVEVAYEFRDKADYLLLSPAEILVRPGFDYKSLPARLMGVEPDLTGVAEDLYKRFANSEYPYLTVSLLKTSELENLASFSAQLLRGIDGESAVDLNDIQNYGFGSNTVFYDFGDYINHLTPDRYTEFKQKLDNCLVYSKATSSYYSDATGVRPIKSYSGLTVYVEQAAYPFLNSEYKKLKWYQRIRQ